MYKTPDQFLKLSQSTKARKVGGTTRPGAPRRHDSRKYCGVPEGILGDERDIRGKQRDIRGKQSLTRVWHLVSHNVLVVDGPFVVTNTA